TGGMCAEPGTPYRRGKGTTKGRIMAAIGDVPAGEVTTEQIEAALAAYARQGVAARSVNKYRQVLCAIFTHALRPDLAARWRVTTNPATAVPRRREDG